MRKASAFHSPSRIFICIHQIKQEFIVSSRPYKPKLSKKFFINMTLVAVISIGLLGFMWVRNEYLEFQKESDVMREDFLNYHKTIINRFR